jgi:hypothetical protein
VRLIQLFFCKDQTSEELELKSQIITPLRPHFGRLGIYRRRPAMGRGNEEKSH